MVNTDPRVDAYIEKSAEFAKPILNHLRDLVHKACPEVIETIKWSFPHFEYAGGNMCSMASFKQHCAFTFWLAALMEDEHGVLDAIGERSAMGHFGRITGLEDLPPDKIFVQYVKEAMALNEQGAKQPKKEKDSASKVVVVPKELTAALATNKKAKATFEAFSPSHKREYTEWIAEAKTEATRSKRIATALEMMQEGKSRNWKYQRTKPA